MTNPATLAAGLAAVFFTFSVPAAERVCLAMDAERFRQVERAAKLGEAWLLRNQRSKGLFLYRFNPDTGTVSRKNNAIRQLMASRVLARLAVRDPRRLPEHRRNLAFVFTHWYREDAEGRGYIFYSGKSKLGANALALRALVASPLFGAHATQAGKLAQGVLSSIQSDGSMRAWFKEPDYPYDEDYLLKFYSGEAILGLLEYAERTADERFATAARRAQAHYLDKYVRRLEENYYPAYVPWHTFALHHEYRRTGEPALAEAAFVLNDELLKILDRQIYIGRFHDPRRSHYGAPHASSDAIYTESLVHAYIIATRAGDTTRAARYAEAIGLAVGFLLKLQYTEGEASAPQEGDRVLGAIRTGVRDRRIRLDNVQHALDAFHELLRLRC